MSNHPSLPGVEIIDEAEAQAIFDKRCRAHGWEPQAFVAAYEAGMDWDPEYAQLVMLLPWNRRQRA